MAARERGRSQGGRGIRVGARNRDPDIRTPASAQPPKEQIMRSIRRGLSLSASLVLALGAVAAHAVDGVNEINDVFILSTGGYPYTLPSSGSYVLTGNLTPPPGAGALVAGADNITIDLNGFVVLGAGGGPAIGIDNAGFTTLVVRNGTVRGFDGHGISLGTDGRVFDTTVFGNGASGGPGIEGFNCLLVHNVVSGNSGDGIVGNRCKIENNIVTANGTAGIRGIANVIVHNQIAGNVGGGIVDAGGSTIQQNVIAMNLAAGITDLMPFGGVPPVPPPAGGPPRSDVMGNVLDNNFGGPGITYDTPALITNNTITNSFGNGVACGAACTIRGNTIDTNNLGGGAGGGLAVADGSTVHANAIGFNVGVGLTIPCTSGYTNNTITFNTVMDVALVGCAGSVTGGFGNNCSGGPCP
jgi:hypothetical protein